MDPTPVRENTTSLLATPTEKNNPTPNASTSNLVKVWPSNTLRMNIFHLDATKIKDPPMQTNDECIRGGGAKTFDARSIAHHCTRRSIHASLAWSTKIHWHCENNNSRMGRSLIFLSFCCLWIYWWTRCKQIKLCVRFKMALGFFSCLLFLSQCNVKVLGLGQWNVKQKKNKKAKNKLKKRILQQYL